MKNLFLKSLIVSGLLFFVNSNLLAQGIIFSKEQIQKIEDINGASSDNWQPPVQPLVEDKKATDGNLEQPITQPVQAPVEEKKTGPLPWLKSKFSGSSKEKKAVEEVKPEVKENNSQNQPTNQPKTSLENKENLEKLINQNKAEQPTKELESPEKQHAIYNYKTSNDVGGKLVLEFRDDEQVLNQDQKLLISALIDKLINSPEIRVVIESYAGKQELESYARKIALKRALEVRKTIKGADIDKKRIIVKVIDYKADSANANKIFVREL